MNDLDSRPTSWFRGSVIATIIAGLLAVFYYYTLPALGHFFEGFYQIRNDPASEWREILLQERLQNYLYFFSAAFLSLVVWTVSLGPGSSQIRQNRWGRLLENRIARFLVAGVCFGLVIALAVLFSNREWNRLGRPCWDNYCLYTELIAQWLNSRTRETFAILLEFMRGYDHANSPLGPLLFSLLKLATGWEVTTAFRLTNLAATVGTGLLLWRCLIRPARLGPFLEGALLFLFGTNMVVARCSFFPQTDALVLFWTTALLVVALRRLDQPGLFFDVCACALLTSGLWVKLSFLPALALIPLWRILVGWRERAFASRQGFKDWIALFAGELFRFVLVPAFCFLGFLHLFGLKDMFLLELHAMKMADTFFPFKLVSLLHAVLVFLILILWGRKRLQSSDHLLLAGAGLYLLSLWLSTAAGWDRFYLPLIPPLCGVAGRGLVVVRETGGPRLVGIFVLLAALLNYCLLYFRLFY